MDQNRMKSDRDRNRASGMDKAEGSRENVRGSGSSSERGFGGSSGTKSSSSNSGGISNRERSREECEQDELPNRGQSSSERE